MGQFELPTVRVVNSTEPSVRFRGERGRFSPWVRAANVPWRESDRPYPWVLQIKMLSVADCPTGYASRVILVDEMRTRFPPRLRGAYCRNVERARGALWASYALAFPHANFFCSNSCSFSIRTLWVTFLSAQNRLKPQTLKLCLHTNIDTLFLLALSPIETKDFQVFKIANDVHFWSKFKHVDCFSRKFGKYFIAY